MDSTFAHTASPKKAAGRALGTMVEVISYYLIKAWGLETLTAIERPLAEYANNGITHNVEFTLHRSKLIGHTSLQATSSTTAGIYKGLALGEPWSHAGSGNILKDGIIKNAFTIANSDDSFINTYLAADHDTVDAYQLDNCPFAMIECKRVGIEDGQKKGPQTIEKAKQGSYVARTVSGIQRFRYRDGRLGAIVEHRNGTVETFEDYYGLLDNAISSHNTELLRPLILTIGIVSNHGNWFTANSMNKEIKVLAQSYDWLLFLTDVGLSSFVDSFLVNPEPANAAVQDAFLASYGPDGFNRFTKTRMDAAADTALTSFFKDELSTVQDWFNVITPSGRPLQQLPTILKELAWLKMEEK